MPDFFATITEADPALVQRWTQLREARSADPEQRAVARGIDTLARWGRIGADTAEALKREAERRVAIGAYFASRTYGSIVAQTPA